MLSRDELFTAFAVGGLITPFFLRLRRTVLYHRQLNVMFYKRLALRRIKHLDALTKMFRVFFAKITGVIDRIV